MRKIFALMAVLMILPVYALDSNIVKQSIIYVTMLSQDPDPVEPGQYVEIRWKVQNLGDESATDFKLELQPEFPFSLDTNEDAQRSLGTINALQSDDQAQVVKYKARVSRDAVEGENSIKLKYTYKDGYGNLQQYTKEYPVDIRTLDATLSIESITTKPGMLEPGKTGEVQVTVKNLADSALKQVTVKMDLTLASLAMASASAATSTSLSSLLDVLPFANIGSGTEKKLPYLKPGEEAIFSYDLVVYPDAPSRVYKVPLLMTFYDDQGTQYTKTDIVGLVVGSAPELEVVLDSSDITQPGTSGRVTFKFINKGVSDIKFVTVKLPDNGDHKTLSADTDYVGNIESDDFQTSDFRIYVEPTSTDKVTLPLQVSYKDSNNNDFTKNIELELKLYTKEQAKQLGVTQSSRWPIYGGLLVVIVIGIFVYRRFRRKK